ncbi:transposase [Planctomycetota bacterium]
MPIALFDRRRQDDKIRIRRAIILAEISHIHFTKTLKYTRSSIISKSHRGCSNSLTPKQYQSGQMERQGRISGQGNKLLRNLLVEVSWVSLRYNPWARDTYNRLLRGSPSRKKIAITALARKLVVRCWAMLRDEQDWKNDVEKNAA